MPHAVGWATHAAWLRRCALAAVFAFWALDAGAAAEPGTGSDEALIRDLIARYARAADAADTELAAEVWETTPGVSFIHPMGHERGWAAIKSNFYAAVMGGFFSQRKLSVKDVAIHTYGDAAWAEFDWDFAATLRSNGSAVDTHGRETQVYRKTGGRWRLVHVHYSPMPGASERRF